MPAMMMTVKAMFGAFALFASMALAHVYKKLSPQELIQAKDIAAQMLKFDGKTNNPQQLTKGEQPWAAAVDMNDQRFDGIGDLLIIEIKDGTPLFPWLLQKLTGKAPDPNKPVKPKKGDHCTAFKIGPDLLATAGHCLRDNNVTPDSPHALIFRRHYDATAAKPYNADVAKTHESVVQEWIYPGEFANTATTDGSEFGFDYAFLRTATPIGGGDAYTLVKPDEFLAIKPHQKLLTVGYPSEFGPLLQMVAVGCKLAAGNDLRVQKDKGLLRTIAQEPNLSLDAIAGNQIFCVSDHGNLQVGGSGGPWLLDIPATDAERAKKLRKVVGIHSWGARREIPLDELYGTNGKTRADWLAKMREQQEFVKLAVSGWFKNKAINVYEAILNSPATKSMLETTIAAEK